MIALLKASTTFLIIVISHSKCIICNNLGSNLLTTLVSSDPMISSHQRQIVVYTCYNCTFNTGCRQRKGLLICDNNDVKIDKLLKIYLLLLIWSATIISSFYLTVAAFQITSVRITSALFTLAK